MNDNELQAAVISELEWDPAVGASHIGVRVKNGAVALTGHVSSYAEKMAAVRATERVRGVRAVADELEVRLGSNARDDAEIAEAVAQALRWNDEVPDTVKGEVRHGIVTLRGEVEWDYQRQAAERAVRNVTGVVGVSNLIAVKPTAKPSEIQLRIADAIKRTATLDAQRITVTTENGTVRLTGTVHSLYEKKLAESAAAAAPGVTKVENELVVVP